MKGEGGRCHQGICTDKGGTQKADVRGVSVAGELVHTELAGLDETLS